MSQQLASDKASAEVLKDSLKDLQETEGHKLVMARLEALLQRDLRLLEAERDPLSVRHLQGRIAAGREMVNLIPDLIRELNNTDYPESESSRGIAD